jgi:hypothetical protein
VLPERPAVVASVDCVDAERKRPTAGQTGRRDHRRDPMGRHPQEQVERATGLAEDDRAVVDSCRHVVAQEADAGTL